jgi:hypothetical protein
VQFTRRKRKRIFNAILPLLAIVWATLPWLPCCQLAAAHVATGHESVTLAALTTEAITTDDSRHCPDSESEASTPVCTDVIRNGNETRATTHSIPCVVLVAFVTVVPSVLSVTATSQPVYEPPHPHPRRSLHLEKSVLLI